VKEAPVTPSELTYYGLTRTEAQRALRAVHRHFRAHLMLRDGRVWNITWASGPPNWALAVDHGSDRIRLPRPVIGRPHRGYSLDLYHQDHPGQP
jgi:hypothetical protein